LGGFREEKIGKMESSGGRKGEGKVGREREREVFGIFCGMCWQWKE